MKKIILGALVAFVFVGIFNFTYAEIDGAYDHKAYMTELVSKIIDLHEDDYSAKEIVDKLTAKHVDISDKKKEGDKKAVDYKKDEYKKDYGDKKKESHAMSYDDCVVKDGGIYEKDYGTYCKYDGMWSMEKTAKSNVVNSVKKTDYVKHVVKKSYRKGDASDSVINMQKKLNTFAQKKGVDGQLKADGKFGPATEEMVRVFQKFYGLYVDGVAGSKTFEKLDYYEAK